MRRSVLNVRVLLLAGLLLVSNRANRDLLR